MRKDSGEFINLSACCFHILPTPPSTNQLLLFACNFRLHRRSQSSGIKRSRGPAHCAPQPSDAAAFTHTHKLTHTPQVIPLILSCLKTFKCLWMLAQPQCFIFFSFSYSSPLAPSHVWKSHRDVRLAARAAGVQRSFLFLLSLYRGRRPWGDATAPGQQAQGSEHRQAAGTSVSSCSPCRAEGAPFWRRARDCHQANHASNLRYAAPVEGVLNVVPNCSIFCWKTSISVLVGPEPGVL